MADCPDTNTQKIEYGGLSTLAQSKVLRAEIDSIDEVNNCSAVTLLDTCEATTGFDFSAVPFDYLCDNKAERTADALLDGYKAFADGDMVYLLFLPEADSAGNQAYIIGHVDIRETKKCQVQEYVLLVLEDGYVTIFDIVNSCTLDLSTFSGSVECAFPAPSTLPCVKDSNFDGWFECNFTKTTEIDATIATVETYYNSSPAGTSSTDEHKITGTCPDTFTYYTHETFSFSYNSDGESYILNNTYYVSQLNSDYSGFEIPKDPSGFCYYYDGTHELLAESFSGSYSGWKFTDIAGGGEDIYINFNITHHQYKERRVNYNPGISYEDDPARYGWIVLAGNESYDIDIVYPYSIQDIGTNTVNSLSLSYLDVASTDFQYAGDVSAVYYPLNHYTPHWLYIEMDSVATGNPMSSESRFFGDTGFFYIRPVRYKSTNNNNTWYRWMSIVALQSDIGEVSLSDPVTIRRYLQYIDNDLSEALKTTAEELFTFANSLYPSNEGFLVCPIQFKG